MDLISFLSALNLNELQPDARIAVAQFCNSTLDYQFSNDANQAIIKDTKEKSFIPKADVQEIAVIKERLSKLIKERNELAALINSKTQELEKA
tara:strand:+ start:1371 stop:1649 length:279 start_codon:yes stop_codon:yes gene_type:complete